MLSASGRVVVLFLAASSLLPAGAPPSRLFTTNDGLIGGNVRRIRLDRSGFLWICTTGGISIYDGRHFTNFTTRDGLPSQNVRDVLQTAAGDYWIGTGAGLARFHPKARPGSYFKPLTGAAAVRIKSVFVLLQGRDRMIWLGTGDGLVRLSPLPGAQPESIDLPANAKVPVLDLKEDARGRLWIATDNGLYVRSSNASTRRDAAPPIEGRISTDLGADRESVGLHSSSTPPIERVGAAEGITEIQNLLLDSRGRLWAVGKGLFELNTSAAVPVVTRTWIRNRGASGMLHAIYEDSSHRLWVAGFGLLKFNPEAPKLPGEPVARSSLEISPDHRWEDVERLLPQGRRHVFALAEDIAGSFWMGLDGLGLRRVSREPAETFTRRDGLGSDTPVGILEDRTGHLHVVTDTPRTLSLFSHGRFTAYPLTRAAWEIDWGWGTNRVLLQTRAGEWWASSGIGVLRYPATNDPSRLRKQRPTVYTERHGLLSRLTLQLFEDSRGDIWAGGKIGASRCSRATGRWTSFPGIEKFPWVETFAEDPSGAVWMGTARGVLLRVCGEKLEQVVPDSNLRSIGSLLIDHLGQLWIGSADGLRLIRNPSAPRPVAERPPWAARLSSDSIFALVEDNDGRLYVSGANGVDRVDPKSGVIRNFSHFTHFTGQQGSETTSMTRDREGAIWFCSAEGLARYRPEPDRPIRLLPPRLSNVTVGATSYLLSAIGEERLSGLQLAPDQNQMAIAFRTPNFDPGERLRYQYRLDGAWSAPSESESVNYAGFPSGNHRFEVRSVNINGLVSPAAVIEFNLQPPIWQRWWAMTLAAIFAALAAYALHLYRVRQLLLVEQVRTRLATDLHDELGTALAEIAILSEVAKRKRGETDVLDAVAQRARDMRLALSDIAWSVDPRRGRLSDLVARMRDMAFRVLEPQACRLQFAAPPEHELQAMNLPPDLRRHLLLFCKEAVSNAARHSGATEVLLELCLGPNSLTLVIDDNGRGFHQNLVNKGQGLLNLRYRATETGGRLEVDSSPGVGCRVELKVPVRR